MVIIDMLVFGVEVWLLWQIIGDLEFNEVFFNDVFVFDEDVVGVLNFGWMVVWVMLGNEWVSIGGSGLYYEVMVVKLV